jgi:2,5-furandicarboxylate decarboxylase 1
LVKDLRDWLYVLETNGLLKRWPEKADIRNCSEIISENHKTATMFEKLEDYQIPVVANAVSSRKMMALALETNEREILTEYLTRTSNPIEPQFNSGSGRCQEQIIASEESEVDLTALPVLLQHEFDGAPFITAGVVVAKDPENREYNIGIYRLMFRTQKELGINITAPHKLRWFYQKALDRKEPLEVAVCLGLHSLDLLAAVTSAPEGKDELALWGGLQKDAIKMVKCKTIDLCVPEHTEIVLEARMDPFGWVEPEGMYGEFPGTYSGMRKNPFLKVQAITSRRNPIYQSATHGGKHLAYTDFFVVIPQIELSILQVLKNSGIDVRQVRILEESAGMVCYFSIQVRAIGDSTNAIHLALAGSRQNFPKYCVVVDSDIDVFDDEAVTWAVSTRSQPKEDTIILEGLRIPSSSDPSIGVGVRSTSKLGIDATVPFDADRTRFIHSKTPRMQEYSASRGKSSGKPIDERVLGILKESGPLFFYEIAGKLSDESFRNILLSWSRLREAAKIEQGMDGKYSVSKQKE